MYKFIIPIDCHPGRRDRLLERPPEAQAATRAEPGCLAYDFFTCTDRPVFVEARVDQAAHGFPMQQDRIKRFMAWHGQFHDGVVFETINVAA